MPQEEVLVGELPFPCDIDTTGLFVDPALRVISDFVFMNDEDYPRLMLMSFNADDAFVFDDQLDNTILIPVPAIRNLYSIIGHLGEATRKHLATVKQTRPSQDHVHLTELNLFPIWEDLRPAIYPGRQTKYKFFKKHKFLLHLTAEAQVATFSPRLKCTTANRTRSWWGCRPMHTESAWSECGDRSLRQHIREAEQEVGTTDVLFHIWVLFITLSNYINTPISNTAIRLVLCAYPDVFARSLHLLVQSRAARALFHAFCGSDILQHLPHQYLPLYMESVAPVAGECRSRQSKELTILIADTVAKLLIAPVIAPTYTFSTMAATLCGSSGIPSSELVEVLQHYPRQPDSGFAAKRDRAITKRSNASSSRSKSPATRGPRAASPVALRTLTVQSTLSILPARPRSADDASVSETSSVTARRTSSRNNPAAVLQPPLPDPAWQRRAPTAQNYLVPLFAHIAPLPIPVVVRAVARTYPAKSPAIYNDIDQFVRIISNRGSGFLIQLWQLRVHRPALHLLRANRR